MFFRETQLLLAWLCSSFHLDAFNSVLGLGPTQAGVKDLQERHLDNLRLLSPNSAVDLLKITLQQYMSCELPDVQPEFRKCRGTRD